MIKNTMVFFVVFDLSSENNDMKENGLAEYQIKPYTFTDEVVDSYAGITFLFVLKGRVQLQSYGVSGYLNKNDLVIINRNSEYRVKGISDNIVIQLRISNHYFTRYYKNYFHYKYIVDDECFPQYKQKALKKLRWLIAKTMMVKVQSHSEMYLEANLLISNIMLTLVSYFQEENSADYPSISQYSDRMERILKSLEANYHLPLTLKSLSEKERLSVPYLSRLFKNEVGLGFSQYLTKLRFQHAVYDLMNSTKPIYRITEDHGFTDSKTFIELFKKQYHSTPSEFRKTHRNEANTSNDMQSFKSTNMQAKHFKNDVAVDALVPLLANIINSTEQTEAPEAFTRIESQVINAQQNIDGGLIAPQNYIVFIGDVLELLKSTIRQQLLHLKRYTEIHYVEVSHLISGAIIAPHIVTDEDYPTYSAYINIDTAIEFLKSNNLSLVSRIYFERARVNLDQYLQKIRQFIDHAVDSYGPEYVATWRFVFYTDIDMPDMHDYFAIFRQVKSVLQSIVPDVSVGIFYPRAEPDDLETLKKHVQALKTIDFFSFRANFHDLIEDVSLSNYESLQSEITYIEKKAEELKQKLHSLGIQVPTYLMEWNTLTGTTRRTNGSYFRGALIFQTLLGVSQHVSAIGVTLNTETQREASEHYIIDTNSIALYYIHLMPRPIFYVLKFLQDLKGQVIARGDDYLITECRDGYYIALVNPSIFNPHLSIEENMVSGFRRKKIVTITGLKRGTYQVKHYLFDQQHGALYHEYGRFKTRYRHDREMIESLQMTGPELTVYDEDIGAQGFSVLADFDINAIHFYKLHRANPKALE